MFRVPYRLITILIISIPYLMYSQDYQGFFNFNYIDSTGKIILEVPELKKEFLFIYSLGTGIGSNDIGLDRGQLGKTRVVHFEKHGDKILLIESNLDYRAISNNVAEVKSVKEAFAFSVLFGFKIEKNVDSKYYIDLTPFLLEDQRNVSHLLKLQNQGTYKLEKSRSTVYLENTFAFPDNVEFESIMTFTGEATGQYIRSVTPTAESFSLRQRISFVKLPDDNYKPRIFHPYSGYFPLQYADYATPISQPLEKRLITRHRLEKKNPSLPVSEPIEPIVYYIDPGCPEPIKSALMDGAIWWNKAFEAAGFINAFEIKVLPEDAHPLDVRYNMIQWVHRSTRGWSYGSSVTDPRTGEIIKGHVSLGSLRVRQDFLIAQGILSPFGEDQTSNTIMEEMALARLRQLSAHEIGHTLGIAHNFSASINGRASVMDYPHPYITLNENGNFDFSQAYDDKIGIWDERVIKYGYSEFAQNENEEQALMDIIKETEEMGLLYLTDQDARSIGSASPDAHLWDNGVDAIREFNRILEVRKAAISRFGLNSIPSGTPLSELEKIFVPVYYMHRYQAEALSKAIGGVHYNFAVKGITKIEELRQVATDQQRLALKTLIDFVSEKNLSIPENIKAYLYPAAFGYDKTRESFPSGNEMVFDEYAAMESAVGHLTNLLLHPSRLNRLKNQQGFNIQEYLFAILNSHDFNNSYEQAKAIFQKSIIIRLMEMIADPKTNPELTSNLLESLKKFEFDLNKKSKNKSIPSKSIIHKNYLIYILKQANNTKIEKKLPSPAFMPPGAPIGCCSLDSGHHFE